jgi:arylsulfatase A-like enzyme
MKFKNKIKNTGIYVFILTVSNLPLKAVEPRPTPSLKVPNVIIVLTDDQGYGDLSLTGNPILKTPNMDRLAREGVQFTNFHADSYCTPTRSTLLTGRYSHRVGGWGTINGRNMLRDDEVTMANIFHHNGYITGLFGKWHLGTSYPYRPIDRGFDEWLGHGDGGTGCTTDYWGNDRVNDQYIHNGQWEEKPRKGYECDVFFDAATQFIRKNKNRPFFTYLALYNPHGPCSIPDPEWAKSYQGENVPGDFYASIVHMDDNLGRLRQYLSKEGLTENTLLIFLSDNGTAEGDKVFNAGMRGKKGSPYDGGHRVPCFLYWPAGGLDMPRTITPLTAHLDWLPTLVDLCRLKLPQPVTFDGISLKPLLEKADFSWPNRTIVLGTPKNNTGANPQSPGFGQNCAVMTDRWRLVNDQELYDMTNDPGQMQNVAGEHPGVVSQLHAFYQKYWEDVSAHDKGWRGRPIIGSPKAPEVALCAEDWFTTQGSCPWNQGAVALGSASFGKWPVRFAEAGTYRIELRRWPRELDAPMDGTPVIRKTVDAWLKGNPVSTTLYNSISQALPVTKAQLRIGENVQEMKVEHGDKAAVFTMKVGAGMTDISTTLFDEGGKSLCSAFYVEIRKL